MSRMIFLLCLTTVNVMAHPGLIKRQVVAVPVPPTPDEEARSGGTLSLSIVIPLACVLAVLVLLAVLWTLRNRLFSKWRRTDTTTTNITAEELATGRRSRSASNVSGPATASGNTGTNDDRNLISSRGGRSRRGRRNIRRTESGRSIRTLPEYSKEAGDEELVLVRSASSIEEDEDDDEEIQTPQAATLEQPQRSGSRLSRFSIRSNRSVQSNRSNRTNRSNRPRSIDGINESQEVTIGDTPSHQPTVRSAPLDNDPATPQRNNSRRGWGEAPTYLEAMSSPSFQEISLEPGIVPGPRQTNNNLTNLRTRTQSSFKGLFTRGIGSFRAPSTLAQRHEMLQTSRNSSTSLLLQPQSSRLSSLTTFSSGSPVQYPSPWASTHSISSPMPDTAIRASFDVQTMPRAGLSDDQMRFLSTTEAVKLVGVKLGDVPANKRRRRSHGVPESSVGGSGHTEIAEDEAPPPGWTEIEAEEPGSQSANRSGAEEVAAAEDIAISSSGGPAHIGTDSGDHGSCVGPSESQLTVTTTPTIVPITATSDTPSVEIEPPTPVTATFGQASR